MKGEPSARQKSVFVLNNWQCSTVDSIKLTGKRRGHIRRRNYEIRKFSKLPYAISHTPLGAPPVELIAAIRVIHHRSPKLGFLTEDPKSLPAYR